ncbi:hypothetical protein B566_EDAN019146, partial [Ephemera danica]
MLASSPVVRPCSTGTGLKPTIERNLKIALEKEYELVMVTNQDGLGTSSFPEETFWPAQNKMLDIMATEGIIFDDISIDFNGEIQAITRLISINWNEIYEKVKLPERLAEVQRNTNETKILVQLNLDGRGWSKIETGIGFFDHMLDQLAKHSGADLVIKVEGDLQIDEHHTIEDTALALGEAYLKAIGDKRGISRYGFLLPMDEALAQVAIDFSGRNWLRIAFFPGSFDPFTKGHEDIVLRGLALFDEIIVGIGHNALKKRYFEIEFMKAKIEETFNGKAVQVVAYDDLTANIAQKHGASFILRGLRNTTDFEYENSISQVNKELVEGLET